MSDAIKGVLAMVATCVTWGLSGIYYAELNHIPPLEVLAHRTIWSCAFFVIVILATGRVDKVREAVASPRTMALLFITALLISANWFGFIFAIQNGQAMEASLGYYIFPLVAVAIGFVVLGERFGRAQAIAIVIAALAVLILTVGLGVPPWIALVLSGTFGFYGLIKKQLAVGPVTSTFLEVSLILPLALIYLGGGVFAYDLRDMLLLMASGVLTGGPLIGFAYAARRLNYATLGLVQYVNPTLQFSVAVFVFGEAFTRWHGIAFPMIWGALALYSYAVWRQDRAARKTSMA
ncbi:EamA family transporter RarD [Pontivivens insulae]|uniref:EamA domain-containing protein n=1 Tax=Pontivivens insulae TaxID=1639689 RepID=A0A2R8AAA0_9RHOB|nr:EamA family transporter RarD [Pontivivens insulae]RED13039.1 chloramphenicol-sensitive protein RarD [Pontivivens insulae]SPF29131.1 hypothetical protein POI8812_01437 [Pontivivens insulae]